MTAKYKPNDVVFIRMNDFSVQKGCVYCVIQKSYDEGIAYSYEVQYARDKIDTFPQNVVFPTVEEAFV